MSASPTKVGYGQTRHFGQPVGRGPATASSTRRELLVAAEQVLAAAGETARLEDVAAAAGVAKSALFRHWSTKDDLVAEVRLRSAERHRGWIEHAGAGTDDPIDGVVEGTVGFFAPRRHALFDPLVTRGALAEPAPELEALASTLDDRAAAIAAGDPELEPAVRMLTDAMVLGTTRGWLGTPGLDQLGITPDRLRLVLSTILRHGLDAIGPVRAPGRRPRRPTPRPLGADGTDRDRRAGALLDAALGVFAATGYEDTRLEDVAAAGGTTASALFTYWPGKEALFLDLRRAVSTQIAVAILEAIAAESTTPARLRAAIGANIRAHYDHPDFQAVLLPVPSLPAEAELESVGWNATISQVGLAPGLSDAGTALPVATAIGLTVLRLSVLTMHRYAIHPAVVSSMATDYLDGAIAALASALGVPFERD